MTDFRGLVIAPESLEKSNVAWRSINKKYHWLSNNVTTNHGANNDRCPSTTQRSTEERHADLLTSAIKDGNFAKVISVVASQSSDSQRQKLINQARRRCELDDFNNKNRSISSGQDIVAKEWYDLTPLALAAIQGHANIVEYLLRQGADPTLRGSPTKGEDYDALEAAKRGLHSVKKVFHLILKMGKEELQRLVASGFNSNSQLDVLQHMTGILHKDVQPQQSALIFAEALVKKRNQCSLCVKMLEAVDPFWPRSQNYTSNYRKRNYVNLPNNQKALRSALDHVSMDDPTISILKADHERMVHRLASKVSALKLLEDQPINDENDKGNHVPETVVSKDCSELKALAIADDENPKKKTRRQRFKNGSRRHSDSYCLQPIPTSNKWRTFSPEAQNQEI